MRYYFSALCLVFLFLSNSLLAGINTYTKKLSGTAVAQSATIDLQDDQYTYMTVTNPSGWASEFTNKKTVNRVSLRFEDAKRVYYSAAWDITVPITLKRWDEDGNAMLPDQTATLTISYKPGAQLTHSNLNVFTSDLAHKTQVVVGTITMNGIATIPADVIRSISTPLPLRGMILKRPTIR
jgi:hypothetical protein